MALFSGIKEMLGFATATGQSHPRTQHPVILISTLFDPSPQELESVGRAIAACEIAGASYQVVETTSKDIIHKIQAPAVLLCDNNELSSAVASTIGTAIWVSRYVGTVTLGAELRDMLHREW